MERLVEFLVLFCVIIMVCRNQLEKYNLVPLYASHRYEAEDLVPLYATKIGPYHNPSETYRYSDLPFCQPDYFKEKQTLDELLSGHHLISAPYKLEFLVDKASEVACSKNLTKEEVSRFRKAIKRDYYFQMYYDDLPIWSFIGQIDREGSGSTDGYKYLLYTHIRFDILFNKDRVIEISALLEPAALVDLTEDKETYVEFVYTVNWKKVDIPFENRMEKYSVLPPHIVESHWYSIISLCLIVVLLTTFFVKFYIRVLKKAFTEGLGNEELVSNQEEREVLTLPVHKSLLAAALGSGTQLFTLTLLILILGVCGVFYPYNRGLVPTAMIIIYTITSSIAGYTSTSIYCHLEGTNWLGNLLLTGCLFPGPLLFTFCLLNSVATAYKASAALPFSTIVELVLGWTLFAFLLLLLGGIIGKDSKVEFQAPSNVAKIPREIPPLPWYRHALPQMALAGILPFSAIYFELYYVIVSMWGHINYTNYKILFIIFILLLIVIAFINVGFTCYQLVAEDHKWWWRSFLCGGSIGFFVYGYCISFYYANSYWSGFLQVSFFLGYMACICYGLFLMFGTVGFVASFLCVRHKGHIYYFIKSH